MTKLLITTDSYFPKRDGVVIFLKKIVPRLSKEFDVTIIAPNFDNKEMKQVGRGKIIGLDVSRKFKLAGYPSMKLSRKNKNIIKQQVKEADIIWAQDPAPIGALSIIYGKKYKKSVLVYMHQIPWEHLIEVLTWKNIFKTISAKLTEWFTKYLYNKCDLVILPYRDLAEELVELGFLSKKAVIKLGVDCEKFRPPKSKAEAKKAINIDPKLRVIAYSGRLSKEKGLQTLRKAFARLSDEHKNLFLLLIGSGTEKSLFKNVHNSRVTGFVKNVPHYLQAADIFVMPSTTETTSLATIEAMSCRIPVVVTKVGYLKDYVIEKFNGLLFPAENEYLLRKKIELLLGDPRLRQVIGKNARKTVKQRFDWEKTVILLNKALKMF